MNKYKIIETWNLVNKLLYLLNVIKNGKEKYNILTYKYSK